FESSDDMAVAIGKGTYTTKDLIQAVFPGYEPDFTSDPTKMRLDDQHAYRLVAGETLTPGVTLHLGQCCMPLPGERILGIREHGRGLVVHTIGCSRLADYDDDADRWVDLQWTELAKTGAVAVARIRVTAVNQKGVLAMLCTAVAQANGNIIAIATGRRAEEFIDLDLDIEVEDIKRMTQILAALRSLAVVDSAVRVQGELDDK
ncbi:MAG: ACT domain-containing protein, partial [Pseudomonadota bacterium]